MAPNATFLGPSSFRLLLFLFKSFPHSLPLRPPESHIPVYNHRPASARRPGRPATSRTLNPQNSRYTQSIEGDHSAGFSCYMHFLLLRPSFRSPRLRRGRRVEGRPSWNSSGRLLANRGQVRPAKLASKSLLNSLSINSHLTYITHQRQQPTSQCVILFPTHPALYDRVMMPFSLLIYAIHPSLPSLPIRFHPRIASRQ